MVSPVLLLQTLVGISFIIASACVFNNYIDRHIDAKMARTKKRALVNGSITGPQALTFASILGVIGAGSLLLFTNLLTLLIAAIGFIVYVVLYGIAKRASVHGTIVGSIAGAVPIVVGYTAVTDRFDAAAFILFIVMVIWQMPHFYAIAMYRRDDYASASLPVLPVIHGMESARAHIIGYVVLFLLASISLTAVGYAGYTYLVVMTIVGLLWLRLGLGLVKTRASVSRSAVAGSTSVTPEIIWAKAMFRFSLIALLVFSTLLSVNNFLP